MTYKEARILHRVVYDDFRSGNYDDVDSNLHNFLEFVIIPNSLRPFAKNHHKSMTVHPGSL
jgi:hypothetical protein